VGVRVQVSEIIFFLLGAMTIVEIVDAHQVGPVRPLFAYPRL
jgi:Na+/H+ antiporter NhaD/arsenite permease-like protein